MTILYFTGCRKLHARFRAILFVAYSHAINQSRAVNFKSCQTFKSTAVSAPKLRVAGPEPRIKVKPRAAPIFYFIWIECAKYLT